MCLVKIYEAAAAVGTCFDNILSCSSSTFRKVVVLVGKLFYVFID